MTRRSRLLAACTAVAVLLLAGCGLDRPGGAGDELSQLKIMAPAAPGGGWDQTSRALQQAMEAERVVGSVQVTNVEGAGGTVGLAQLASSNDDRQLMTMGLVMVGAVETNDSEVTLEQVTPIARLTGEGLVLVVPASSPHRTLADFVTAWRADPGGTPIAGGSAGGADQILAVQIAKESGIGPKSVNYVAFSGGGESLAALLGGQVAAGVSGVAEYAEQVKAGELRALAVSGRQPSSQLPEVATLRTQGVDVELTNWRGVVARPGLPEEARTRLVDAVTRAHESATWQQTVRQRGWEDQFQPAAAFDAFLDAERQRVRQILIDIDLIEGG